MTRLEGGCHTRRSKHRIVERRPGEAPGRGGIRSRLGNRAHVERGLPGLESGASLEKGPGEVVEMNRKSIRSEPRYRGRKAIDRVVGCRKRAVAARVRDLEREVEGDLLRHLNHAGLYPALFRGGISRVRVEHVLR